MEIFSSELGKAFNMVEFMINLLKRGEIKIFIENKFNSLQAFNEKISSKSKMLGSSVITFGLK
jgi:hypothetical protein